MIRITDDLKLDEGEIDVKFIRAGGPGGQKVDRTASAVQLRFNVPESDSLPNAVKARLRRIASNQINKAGELIIEAKAHRSQTRNRQEALSRLVKLLQRAARPPKPRRPTRPSRSAKERRLRDKKMQSRKKRQRRFNSERDL
jgi:ribosome-associated protein